MIERPINKAKNSSNGFLVYYTQKKKKSKEKRPSIISFQQCDMILILLLLNELMLEPYHHDKELGLNKLHKETFNYLNSWRQKKKYLKLLAQKDKTKWNEEYNRTYLPCPGILQGYERKNLLWTLDGTDTRIWEQWNVILARLNQKAGLKTLRTLISYWTGPISR